MVCVIFTGDWQQIDLQSDCAVYIPASHVLSSSCSTFPGALHVGGHLNISPYSECVMLSHCGFNLHFSYD